MIVRGDLCVIRTTHPSERLHGVLVACELSVGDMEGYKDVWLVTFLGAAQRSDCGVCTFEGLIPERHLFKFEGALEVINEALAQLGDRNGTRPRLPD